MTTSVSVRLRMESRLCYLFTNYRIVGVGCVTDKEVKRVFVLPQYQVNTSLSILQ